jgi:hypothetical protein
MTIRAMLTTQTIISPLKQTIPRPLAANLQDKKRLNKGIS